MTRHLLSLRDLGPEGVTAVLQRAIELKALRGRADHPTPLAGKSVGVLMEKSSTRTRISFEVGIAELGGHPVPLAGRDMQISRDEPLEDTARVLSRYLAAVVMRTYGQERLERLAAGSEVPFVNALTDLYHPCQVLADLQTVVEHRDRGLRDLSVAWIGDGNNMAHSWMLAAALCDFELRLACPDGYCPDPGVLAIARELGGGRVVVSDDPAEAARGAHVVTTDVWTSMGQEEESATRRAAFDGFCVNRALMALAAPDAIFLHCLPAHRGEEVEAAVIDGPASRVWDEAENRLHAQKALLEYLLAGD